MTLSLGVQINIKPGPVLAGQVTGLEQYLRVNTPFHTRIRSQLPTANQDRENVYAAEFAITLRTNPESLFLNPSHAFYEASLVEAVRTEIALAQVVAAATIFDGQLVNSGSLSRESYNNLRESMPQTIENSGNRDALVLEKVADAALADTSKSFGIKVVKLFDDSLEARKSGKKMSSALQTSGAANALGRIIINHPDGEIRFFAISAAMKMEITNKEKVAPLVLALEKEVDQNAAATALWKIAQRQKDLMKPHIDTIKKYIDSKNASYQVGLILRTYSPSMWMRILGLCGALKNAATPPPAG